MPDPLVSVILTTKDRPEFLAEAVTSVLCQTYEQLELVVVDDGSAPPAEPGAADPRIRVVRLPVSMGLASARNRGLEEARGDYICLLDDDDRFFPDKIRFQLSYLSHHSELDIVFSQVLVTKADGSTGFRLPDDYRHDPLENLRLFNVIHPNSVLFRRRVAESVRYDTRLKRFTDTQFFVEAAFRFNTAFLPGEVATWNCHDRDRRITAPDLQAERNNLRIFLSIFEDVLDAHPDLRRSFDELLDSIDLRILKSSFARSSCR